MVHEKFQNCIEACYQCAEACDFCATACLQESDMKAMTKCIMLDLYCADICRLAATFMARGDLFAQQICNLCAEICEACGKECEKHQTEHCQNCARACMACAVECRIMATGE